MHVLGTPFRRDAGVQFLGHEHILGHRAFIRAGVLPPPPSASGSAPVSRWQSLPVNRLQYLPSAGGSTRQQVALPPSGADTAPPSASCCRPRQQYTVPPVSRWQSTSAAGSSPRQEVSVPPPAGGNTPRQQFALSPVSRGQYPINRWHYPPSAGGSPPISRWQSPSQQMAVPSGCGSAPRQQVAVPPVSRYQCPGSRWPPHTHQNWGTPLFRAVLRRDSVQRFGRTSSWLDNGSATPSPSDSLGTARHLPPPFMGVGMGQPSQKSGRLFHSFCHLFYFILFFFISISVSFIFVFVS